MLEREGLIRHIRVSNEGDVVPAAPPAFSGYTQNGINIRFRHSDQMEVGYRNLQSLWNQSSFRPVRYHTLKQHLERLLRNSQKLKKIDMGSLYQDKSTVGDFST